MNLKNSDGQYKTSPNCNGHNKVSEEGASATAHTTTLAPVQANRQYNTLLKGEIRLQSLSINGANSYTI